MAYKQSLQRFRRWYSKLINLYPKSYRDRFGEGMEQTFSDLIRERERKEKGLFTYVAWMFVETSVGVIRENLTFIIMENIKNRLVAWTIVIASILSMPLIVMQFTNEVRWDSFDFIIVGTVLFGISLVYELIARRSEKTVYRAAFIIGLLGAFLLFWVNGAVGIIGSENQSPNLLYGAVFFVGLIGSLASRFRPKGMARTLFIAAAVQISIPVVALIIWPPPATSWSPSVFGVFILNGFFATLFFISALLFRRAAFVNTSN